MSYLKHTRKFKGIVDVFMRDARRYLPFLEFIHTIMEGESEFTKSERELIATYVSKLNGCRFCGGAHRAVLNAMNIDDGVINAVESYPTTEGVDLRMRPVLDFAGKLTLTPDKIEQADIDDLRDAGWSDQAIEDAIGVIALYAFVNRLVEGVGIKGSPEYFQYIGTSFAQKGYGQLVATAKKKLHEGDSQIDLMF